MKHQFTIGTISTILLAAIFQSFLPWWTLLVAGAICGALLPLSGFRNFAYGFLGGAMLWGGYALWLDTANDGVLSARMAALFSLPSGFAMVLVTLLLGGLVGGIGAMTGFYGAGMLKGREG